MPRRAAVPLIGAPNVFTVGARLEPVYGTFTQNIYARMYDALSRCDRRVKWKAALDKEVTNRKEALTKARPSGEVPVYVFPVILSLTRCPFAAQKLEARGLYYEPEAMYDEFGFPNAETLEDDAGAAERPGAAHIASSDVLVRVKPTFIQK